MPNVMASQPNICGALCALRKFRNSVRRRKMSLTPTAWVPCSNAASIGERNTWTQNELCTWQNSVLGQEPQKMYIHRVTVPAVFPPCCRSSSVKCFLFGHHFLSKTAIIGSRPSDHYFRSVCLSVCLCRVFISRLWSDFDQTRTYVICLVVSPRI